MYAAQPFNPSALSLSFCVTERPSVSIATAHAFDLICCNTFEHSSDNRISGSCKRYSHNKDSFAEIVSLINAVDTTNDNAFASYALATDASVDSIELALSAEIVATNADVTAINGSIDSLETALAAEISATNADVIEINSSIDSLEIALGDEEAARIAGDTYKEQTVTGIASGKAFVLASGVKFGATNDLEVFVNGLKVAFTTTDGISFEIVSSYELESTDKVTVLGIQA